MNHKAVVFSALTARVFHGINPDDYKSVPDCLIDPELPKGVPPHYWKMERDKVLEMSAEEKSERDRLLALVNPKHNRGVVPISEPPRILTLKEYLTVAAIAACMSTAMTLFIDLLFH